MITVSIAINGEPIYARSAVNITEEVSEGRYARGGQVYKLDTGEIVTHKYEDGAIVLAKKMLDTMREV